MMLSRIQMLTHTKLLHFFVIVLLLSMNQACRELRLLDDESKVKIHFIQSTIIQEENGMIDTLSTESVLYSKDGELKKRNIYRYNEKNEIVEQDIYSYNDSGEFTEIKLFNKLVPSSNCIITFEFDAKGNCIKETQNFYNNNQIDSTRTFFDSNGELIESFNYTSGILRFHNVYEHDTIENIKTISFFNNDGICIRKTYEEYDQMGNWVKTITDNLDGKRFVSSTITYDDKGNTIAYRSYNSTGEVNFKVLSSYDQKGNRVEEHVWSIDNGEEITTHEYEYDKEGNWIKRTSETDNEPNKKEIEYRHIKYYE